MLRHATCLRQSSILNETLRHLHIPLSVLHVIGARLQPDAQRRGRVGLRGGHGHEQVQQGQPAVAAGEEHMARRHGGGARERALERLRAHLQRTMHWRVSGHHAASVDKAGWKLGHSWLCQSWAMQMALQVS